MNETLLDDNVDPIDPVDENKNYLEELVGEDKKFKSVEDLAKGKAQSDTYIKTLEERLDEMREDYLKLREEHMAGPKLQELLDKLDSERQLTREPPITQEVDKATALDPKAVESLVSSSIQKYEQTKKEQENYTLVKNKLIEHFGSKYQESLKARSAQLGLSEDEVNAMARKNPKLFTKTFDLEMKQTENFQTPPRSERRSDTFAPRSPTKRNWAYYQDMRRKDPVAWMDRKIAVQMEKDAQEQGDSFYLN